MPKNPITSSKYGDVGFQLEDPEDGDGVSLSDMVNQELDQRCFRLSDVDVVLFDAGFAVGLRPRFVLQMSTQYCAKPMSRASPWRSVIVEIR